MERSRKLILVPGLAILALVLGYATMAPNSSRQDLLADAADAAKKYAPVAPLEVVMEGGQDVFDAFEETLGKKRFVTLRKKATFLAELMNISAHYKVEEAKGKEKEWVAISTQTKDLLLEMAALSKKKDAAAVTAMIEKVDASCESCHEKFRD